MDPLSSFPASLPPGSLLPSRVPPALRPSRVFLRQRLLRCCTVAPPPVPCAPPPHSPYLGTIRSNSRCAGGRSGTRNLSVNSTICISNTCLAKKNCSSPGTLPFSLQVRQAGCSRSNSCVATYALLFFANLRCSLLYRRQILQQNIRWKALDEPNQLDSVELYVA